MGRGGGGRLVKDQGGRPVQRTKRAMDVRRWWRQQDRRDPALVGLRPDEIGHPQEEQDENPVGRILAADVEGAGGNDMDLVDPENAELNRLAATLGFIRSIIMFKICAFHQYILFQFSTRRKEGGCG